MEKTDSCLLSLSEDLTSHMIIFFDGIIVKFEGLTNGRLLKCWEKTEIQRYLLPRKHQQQQWN